MEKNKYIKIIAVMLPVIFGIVIYFPAVWFDYVWDDFHLFLDSAALRGGSELFDAIAMPILPGTTYFRPLVMLTFYIEFLFGDPNPVLSHAINIILYAINIILVILIILRYARMTCQSINAAVVFISASFYALHPALTETTAWVSGRFDLLMTSFYLLALLCGLGRSFLSLTMMSIFFFASLACKEMAITFPVVLLMLKFSIYCQKDNFQYIGWLREEKKLVLSIVLTITCYLALRYAVLIDIFHVNVQVASELRGYEHFYLVGNTFVFYIQRIIWPFFSSSPLYPVTEYQYGGLGVVLIFTVLIFGCVAIYKKLPAACLVLLIPISLLPVLQIIPLTVGGNIGHDRFLALPLVFTALSVSQLIKTSVLKWRESSRWIGLISVVYLSAAAFIVFNNKEFWRSNVSLWSWAYAVNSNSSYARNNLVGAILNSNGNIEYARKLLDEAGGVADMWGGARSRTLMLDFMSGDYDGALNKIDILLAEKDPPHAKLAAIGVDWRTSDAPPREKFADIDSYKFLYSIRAETLIRLRRYSEAEESALAAVFYQKDSCRSQHLLGYSRRMQGKFVEAIASQNIADKVCTAAQTKQIEAALDKLKGRE